MSGHYNPTSGPATGGDSSARPLYNNQSRAIGVVSIHQHPGPSHGEQSGATQHMEQPPLTHNQHLEMLLQRQYRFIQDHLRRWFWPPQAPGVNSNVQPVSIDSNAQVIVPRDFVAQAHRSGLELRDLKKALDEKAAECDRIREHWQAAIGELSDLKSSKQIFMVDDAEMVSKWNQLQYGIKNLARTYLHDPISPKRLAQKQRALLKSVSPLYQEYLSAKGQVHLLFQSLLWMQITESILLKPTNVWGDNLSVAFDILLKVGQKSKEDYHSWRAQTGGIIQDARGTDNQTERQLKSMIYSTIAPFILKETLSDERHGTIIHRSIERIVDKAIDIAVIFNQSRCVYRLRRVIHRERFSPRTMEFDEECNAPQVDLMISPGLLKYGNSKGEDYDQRLVLAKSHVCILKQDAEEETEETESDTDESDGEGNKEGKEDEDESLIEL
ncbi:hypothetical protein F4801DRAFT_576974 [Xylaria longipes]|nr:hypothetical protein F4801DRAFT_576974 [Xylaria longipes]